MVRPLHNPHAMHAQAQPIPMQQAEPTVLIVEDERVSRRALSSLLASCGFRAAACESAEEALERVGASRTCPQVALVDVDLPGMSGLDLVRRLEQLHPGIRAVLITAAEGDRIAQFRRDHEVDYLPKPVDFPRLLNLLTRSQLAH